MVEVLKWKGLSINTEHQLWERQNDFRFRWWMVDSTRLFWLSLPKVTQKLSDSTSTILLHLVIWWARARLGDSCAVHGLQRSHSVVFSWQLSRSIWLSTPAHLPTCTPSSPPLGSYTLLRATEAPHSAPHGHLPCSSHLMALRIIYSGKQGNRKGKRRVTKDHFWKAKLEKFRKKTCYCLYRVGIRKVFLNNNVGS